MEVQAADISSFRDMGPLANTISCASRYPPNHGDRIFIVIPKSMENVKVEDVMAWLRLDAQEDIQIVKKNYHVHITKRIRYRITVDIKNDQWWIRVPVLHKERVFKLDLFCDTGANVPVCNEEWAEENFSDILQLLNDPLLCDTPNGELHLRKFITLNFPTNYGTIISCRHYCCPKLPVMCLCDINQLKFFGFKFENGTPEPFKHVEEKDMELDCDPESIYTQITPIWILI